MDDPIADIAAYGHFSVMKLAADHGIKVMLSGIGGDEIFWGYDWVIAATQLTQQKQQLTAPEVPDWAWTRLDQIVRSPLYSRAMVSRFVPTPIRLILHQLLEFNAIAPQHPQQAVFYNIRPEFRNAWYHHQTLYTKEFLAQIPQRNPFQLFETFNGDWHDMPTQITRLLFDTWLVSNCLALGDRTSMASSLEVRMPLLDHKLIELVIGLHKHDTSPISGHHKAWLKAAIGDLLPDEILNRPKRGFEPPYKVWIKSLLDQYGEQVINGYLVSLGFFVRPQIQKIFIHYQQNLAMVYKLIVLELWYREIALKPVEKTEHLKVSTIA
jgi:asparagine synthase (glutamine-hydrolysing)